MKRYHLIIKGKVQGVCFRLETVGVAKQLGLTGWVKNLPDGSVESIAEGPEKKLKEFKTWCFKGPPRAQVSDVAITRSEATGEFSSFMTHH